MARYKRIKRKEDLKAPDEFVSFWDSVYFWVADNGEKVLYPLVGIIIIFMVSAGYAYYQDSRENTAQRELYRSLANYPSDNPQEGASISPNDVDMKKLAETIGEVSDRFSGTLGGKLAGFYQANVMYKDGKMAEAEALYKSGYESDGADGMLGRLSGISLARVYQNQQKYSDAIGVLEKLKESKVEAFMEEIDYLLAMNYELSGDSDRALETYVEFLGKYQVSSRRDMVVSHIADLQGTDIKLK